MWIVAFAILLGPAVIVLAVPLRFGGRFVLFLVAVVALSWRLTPPVPQFEDEWGSDIGVFLGSVITVAALFVLIAKYPFVRRRAPATEPPSVAMVRVDHLLATFAGAVAALILFAALAFAFDGVDSALVAHLGVVVTAGVFLAAASYVEPILPRWGVTIFATMLVLLSGWSYVFYPNLVSSRAAAAAAGEEHCISLPTRWRPAVRRSDLTFLTFDKTDLHARLTRAGEPGLYWSFYQRDFLPIPHYDTRRIHCDPAGQSGLSRDLAAEGRLLEVNGVALRIPHRYLPRPLSDGDLYFNAEAPDFLSGNETNQDLLSLRAAPDRLDPGAEVRPLPTAPPDNDLGLVIARDRDGLRIFHDYTEGRVTTSINCNAERCGHSFLTAGLMATLMYSPELLPRWQEMQLRLAGMIDDWRAAANE